MIEFLTISRDPNGVYVGVTFDLQLYYWNYIAEVWIPILGPSSARRIDG
jgi:hypothetical protein